jgi:hypothetical protein
MMTGDSGSWVIHERHGIQEVIGHVVAIDGLGQVYIMPLGDTFGDMKKRLGASSIHLTTSDELEAMLTTRNLSPSVQCSPVLRRRTEGLPETENVRNWLLNRETKASGALLDSFARYKTFPDDLAVIYQLIGNI